VISTALQPAIWLPDVKSETHGLAQSGRLPLYVWAKLTPASPLAIAKIESLMAEDADHGWSADSSDEVGEGGEGGKKGRVEKRVRKSN